MASLEDYGLIHNLLADVYHDRVLPSRGQAAAALEALKRLIRECGRAGEPQLSGEALRRVEAAEARIEAMNEHEAREMVRRRAQRRQAALDRLRDNRYSAP